MDVSALVLHADADAKVPVRRPVFRRLLRALERVFAILGVLFLIYFPAHRKLAPYNPQIHYGRPPIARSREWKVSITVLYSVIVHFLLVLSVTVYLLVLVGDSSQRETYLWAGFLGVISMMMASVQYLPQIHTTWKMKVCDGDGWRGHLLCERGRIMPKLM